MRVAHKFHQFPLATCFLVSTFIFFCILGLRSTGLLEPLELAAYDWSVRTRPTVSRADPRIVLLTSTDIEMQWPLPDQILAQALERLTQYHPRAIGLDLYRDGPLPPGSEALNAVLVNNPRIVAVTKFGTGEEQSIPPPAVLRGTERVGFNDFILDPGGMVRRGLLFLDDGTEVFYALALRLALLYLQEEGITLQPDDLNPAYLRLGQRTIRPFEANDGGYVGADAHGYQFLLDFRGARGTSPAFYPAPLRDGERPPEALDDQFRDTRGRFPAFSLTHLLAGKVRAEDLQGKIVLLGVTAESVKDAFYTPYSRGVQADQQVHGMALHAHIVSQLLRFGLDGDAPIVTMSDGQEALWLLLWGMLAGVIWFWGRSSWRFALVGAGGLLVLFLSTYGALLWGWWIPLVPPALAWLCTELILTFVLWPRSDPIEVARQFFVRANFQRVEAVSPRVLRLRPYDGAMTGIAMLWQDEPYNEAEDIFSALLESKQQHKDGIKLYIVYKGPGPSSDIVQTLRGQLGCEIIPLLSPILDRALAIDNCEEVLKELEEPYLTRLDPYDESKPIYDPTWFYGRDEFLRRLPAALAQGQHVGIFGLRKVGKTSLTNQLRQRFVSTPTVFIDCQGFAAKADSYWAEILRQLHDELDACGMKGLPRLPPVADVEHFRRHLGALFTLWEKSGQRRPFCIILDEIDKFFPSAHVQDSEEIWAEYVRFFRAVRGLAQSQQCLVTLVIAYRPDINRRNLLTPTVGENPMFQSFQEEYLGSLSAADSTTMIREIGLWKQIVWEVDAAQRVFYYCGGHPLVTRFFASHACEAGTLKAIDYSRVEETAEEIRMTLRQNEIGNYYKEGVWDLLRDEEQQVLALICQNGEKGLPESHIPRELEDALTNLEHFGLVSNANGNIYLSAYLFHAWLQRRMGL